jgi:hypothetical protein
MKDMTEAKYGTVVPDAGITAHSRGISEYGNAVKKNG